MRNIYCCRKSCAETHLAKRECLNFPVCDFTATTTTTTNYLANVAFQLKSNRLWVKGSVDSAVQWYIHKTLPNTLPQSDIKIIRFPVYVYVKIIYRIKIFGYIPKLMAMTTTII